MSFNDRFRFSFYDMMILIEKEKHERTRQHEGGHLWIGDSKKAELVGNPFDPQGTSQVLLRGLKDLQDFYEVGVAGMLAEALGVQRKTYEECAIDLERLPALARYIYDTLKDAEPNPDSEEASEPNVPVTCFPSTIRAQISVSDMVEPIKSGLDEKHILSALNTVARRFNDHGEWDEFQAFVDKHYPKYDG